MNNETQPHDKKAEGKQTTNSLAVAGMILGIIAICGGWIPIINVVFVIVGFVGIVLSAIGLIKAFKTNVHKGFAIAGLVCSLLSVALFFSMYSNIGKTPENATTQQNKDSGQSSSTASSSTVASEPLTLEEGWTVDKSNPYSVFIDGYVKNNTDKEYKSYISITFNAYSAEGDNLGDCLANTNTIDANGRWKFHAFCSTGGSANTGEVETIKFNKISGF